MSCYDPGSEPSKIVRETRLFESAPDRIGVSDKLKFNAESDISDIPGIWGRQGRGILRLQYILHQRERRAELNDS